MTLPPINFTGSSNANARQFGQVDFRSRTNGGSIYELPSFGSIIAIGAAVSAVMYALKRRG